MEAEAGRWRQGLTAEKIKECVWLEPEAVARIDFLEWTRVDHLRHTKFVALRDDKGARRYLRRLQSRCEGKNAPHERPNRSVWRAHAIDFDIPHILDFSYLVMRQSRGRPIRGDRSLATGCSRSAPLPGGN